MGFSEMIFPTKSRGILLAHATYGAKCIKTCDKGKFLVVVRVLTDSFPAQTAWTLSNNGVKSRSNSYTVPNTWHQRRVCVPKGQYTFTITDKGDNGICCGYGDGKVFVLWKNGLWYDSFETKSLSHNFYVGLV